MKMSFSILIVLLLSSTLLTSAATVNAAAPILSQKDNAAKQTIITNASLSVDHKWDRFDLITGSVKGDNSTFTIYNSTGNFTIPPIVCGEGTHEDDGICIPDVVVPPDENQTNPPDENQTNPPVENETDTDTGETTVVNAAGDFSGTSVINVMKGDFNVALGDLLYQSSLDPFMKVWSKDNKHGCVPGNHDQDEDGNSKIAQQSSEYCGDIWTRTIAGGTTMLMGVNTNGNLDTLLGTAQGIVMSPDFDAKNLILFTHKPCHINSGAHHPVEGNVKTFCQSLEGKVPAGVKLITIAGHEHNAQQNDNDKWFIAGTGGKGKYNCGSTSGGWSFCNDNDNGYLKLTIDNDSGEIKTQFIKTSGGVMS